MVMYELLDLDEVLPHCCYCLKVVANSARIEERVLRA